MIYFQEERFSCVSCIKGHRASECLHFEKPLFSVKGRGNYGEDDSLSIRLKLPYQPAFVKYTLEAPDSKNGKADPNEKIKTLHICPDTACSLFLVRTKPKFSLVRPLSPDDLSIVDFKLNESPRQSIMIVDSVPRDSPHHPCNNPTSLKRLRSSMYQELCSQFKTFQVSKSPVNMSSKAGVNQMSPPYSEPERVLLTTTSTISPPPAKIHKRMLKSTVDQKIVHNLLDRYTRGCPSMETLPREKYFTKYPEPSNHHHPKFALKSSEFTPVVPPETPTTYTGTYWRIEPSNVHSNKMMREIVTIEVKKRNCGCNGPEICEEDRARLIRNEPITHPILTVGKISSNLQENREYFQSVDDANTVQYCFKGNECSQPEPSNYLDMISEICEYRISIYEGSRDRFSELKFEEFGI